MRKRNVIVSAVIATLISVPVSAQAAFLVGSIVDDNGEWSIGGNTNSWITGTVAGIGPTVGTDTMHFNDGQTFASGTHFIVFSDLLSAGTYTAQIDVGNYNNRPLATIGNVGMTVGGSQPTTPGTLLTPTTSSTPSPALGQYETWSFSYDILAGDSNIGSAIGFSITVPFNGAFNNVAFDNLSIDFVPAPGGGGAIPEPTTLVIWSLLATLGITVGWRRSRRTR